MHQGFAHNYWYAYTHILLGRAGTQVSCSALTFHHLFHYTIPLTSIIFLLSCLSYHVQVSVGIIFLLIIIIYRYCIKYIESRCLIKVLVYKECFLHIYTHASYYATTKSYLKTFMMLKNENVRLIFLLQLS